MEKGLFRKYIISKRCDRKSDFKPSIGKTQLMRIYKRRVKRLLNKELSD
jgi:hypothetical protein